MAQVEIVKSLFDEINKKFKKESILVFQYLKSLEDSLCAQAIHNILTGKPGEIESYLTKLRTEGRGTERMIRTGLNADLEFCLTANFTSMIPYVDKTEKEMIVRGK